MSWLNAQTALAFFAGCMVGVLVYVVDWIWNVKIAPKRRKDHYPDSKTINAALKENEKRKDADRTRAERRAAELADLPPAPPPASPAPDAPEHGPVTDALPATQEHPAPSTAFIDMSRPPPQLPYSGPERRLRSENPYPELRRRAADRERWEDTITTREPTAVSTPPRLTRAEERRRREAGDTESDHTDTDGE